MSRRADDIAAAADTPSEAGAPSWLDRLMVGLERSPGPAWAPYAAIAVGSILVLHLLAWMTGAAPGGALQGWAIYWSLLTPTLLWTWGYLGRVAASTLEETRPVLRCSEVELVRLRFDLTVIPMRPSLVVTLAGILVTGIIFAVDPASSDVSGAPWPLFLAVLALQAFDTVLLFLALYRLMRQMGLIRRILEHEADIDLFRPGPVNALSQLTATSGIALVLLVASALLATSDPTEPGNLPYLVVPPIVASLAFLVPVVGTYGRLMTQKRQLQDEAGVRLASVVEEVNADIDARRLEGLEPLNRAVAALLQQRDVLAHLTTWPWSTGTLRGFVTLILLPLVLYVVQQFIGRFL